MFPEMSNTPIIFKIMPVIVLILIVCVFGFTFAMIFNTKLRSKFMGKQLKMQKHMLDANKEIIKDIHTTTAGIGIDSRKKIIDENGDVLAEIASKSADINAVGIEKLAKAVKKGLTEESIYCKHCGKDIDVDSMFCKKCGKKQ